MSDELDLDAIEARADAASGGPWAYEVLSDKGGAGWAVGVFYDCTQDDFPSLCGRIESERYNEKTGVFERVADAERIICDSGMKHNDGPNIRDAEFIAAARTDVPALIARVRADAETIAQLQAKRHRAVDLASHNLDERVKERARAEKAEAAIRERDEKIARVKTVVSAPPLRSDVEFERGYFYAMTLVRRALDGANQEYPR